MYSWSKDWPTLTELFFGKEEAKEKVDINQEAQDEILSSTGKIDFTKDSEYIRLFGE